MRHQILVRSFVLVVAIVVAGSQAAAEGQGRDRGSQERDGGSEGQDRGSRQGAAAGLVVPIVGTTSAGGTFSGTLTVQRFIARGGNIFAVGLVTGAVTVPGQPVGTLLNGPKEIPVIVSQGTSAGLAPSSSMIRPVGGLGRPAPRGLILVQAQQTCGVLHLDLGTTTLNALGLTITTSPITLDISGNSGGVLGNLVCQALGLLNSVVNLAGVLNQFLGVLGGGLGGLIGGLGV